MDGPSKGAHVVFVRGVSGTGFPDPHNPNPPEPVKMPPDTSPLPPDLPPLPDFDPGPSPVLPPRV